MNIKALARRSVALVLASAWALLPAQAANDPGPGTSEGGPDLLAPGTDDVFAQATGWKLLSAAKLDRVRGGFDLPDLQLKLSFGFDQAVFVNGELVARTVLTMEQLRSSVASEMEALRSQTNAAAMSAEIQSRVAQQLAAAGIQATVAQPTDVHPAPVVTSQIASVANPPSAAGTPTSAQAATTAPGPVTPVVPATLPVAGGATQAPNAAPASTASSLITAAGAPVVSAPPLPRANTGAPQDTAVTATSPPATSSTAAQQPPSTTVTSSQTGTVTTVVNDSSFTPVLVIQNGGGNTVGSSAASSPASSPVSTVVQNSLDDQRIQVLTEISASANSLEIMRAMNLGSSIREGLINSLRR